MRPLVHVCVLAGLALGQAATAAPPRALLYTEAGHPLSLVPGRTDGMTITSFSIGQSAYSRNGRAWVVSAVGSPTATLPASPTLVFTGTARGITSVAVQSEPLPGLGLAFASSPDSLAVNDRGDAAFHMVAANASSADRVLIARYRADTGLYEQVARQNDPIPGVEQSVPGATGERYGSALSVSSVLDDGRVAFLAQSTTGPLPTEADEFLFVEGDPVSVKVQAGRFVPDGQAGGGQATLGNLERRASVSGDGRQWLAWGQLDAGAFSDVVVVDGRVVLEEGAPVPGLAGDVFAPAVRMAGSGRWFARGTSTAGVQYLVVDGQLRLTSGGPPPGLPALGNIVRIDHAAVNAPGDLAYAIATADGQSHIVIEPGDGTAAFVAVDNRTRLDVGGSPRGPIFYGSTLGSDLGLGLSDNGRLYFFTRSRDRQNLNTGDGLYVWRWR